MKVTLCLISPRRGGPIGPASELLRLYIERANRYAPTSYQVFATEAKLLEFVEEGAGRTRPALWLMDSRGKQPDSKELALWVEGFQDQGGQQLIVAVGPADGWSPVALARAERTIAFGRVTLPHELAAVITAEQIYRAFTIRAGHPYHSGH